MINKICDQCYEIFSVISSRKNKAKFCSRSCYANNLKGRIGILSSFYGKKHSKKTKQLISDKKKGIRVSINTEFKKGDNSGEKSRLWRGGRNRSYKGYILVYCPDHPNRISGKYVYEHRLIVEKAIGRYLEKEEAVHHINGIRDDNRIENLMVFKKTGYHSAFHKWGTYKKENVSFDGREHGIS